MVNYLDRPDLPDVLVSALQDKAYSEELATYFDSLSEESRALPAFSTTTLPRPARQKALYDRHSHRVYLDPLKNWWKLGGNIIHGLLEKHGDSKKAIIEKRIGFDLELSDKRMIHVHGKPDVFYPKEGLEQDYKWTSVWGFILGEKFEHIAQLNINALILRQKGFKVTKLQNLLMFRDWRGSDANRIKGYPKEPAVLVDQPVWDNEQIQDYINSRALIHLEAAEDTDEELIPCSPAERWESAPLNKVFKIEPDTGLRQKICKHKSSDYAECVSWIEEHKKDAKGNDIVYLVDTFKSMPRRCGFCEISAYCSQHKEDVKQFKDNQSTEEQE